jgi:sugar phosphate isomerase/epimerase
VDFWGRFVEEAEVVGIQLLLENLWEDEPALIAEILAEVNHPCLRACLDVAHATLFSPAPVSRWIEAIAPYLYCCHLNNNDGEMDLHWPLSQGVIDYAPILAELRRRQPAPLLTLEMPSRERMVASLPLLELEGALP